MCTRRPVGHRSSLTPSAGAATATSSRTSNSSRWRMLERATGPAERHHRSAGPFRPQPAPRHGLRDPALSGRPYILYGAAGPRTRDGLALAAIVGGEEALIGQRHRHRRPRRFPRLVWDSLMVEELMALAVSGSPSPSPLLLAGASAPHGAACRFWWPRHYRAWRWLSSFALERPRPWEPSPTVSTCGSGGPLRGFRSRPSQRSWRGGMGPTPRGWPSLLRS